MSICARFRSAALIACTGAALLCAQAAHAATFNVTTNADTGVGSLREAISAANANPGADTILFTFAVPMPPIFLNLSTALPTITDSVTITGPGTGLIIQPNAAGPANFPIFTITGTPTVEIQNLSISNGRGLNGAGIVAVGGTLTVRGCFINDNIATGSGGGIYMSGAGNATLNIIDTQIFNNRAGETGGGVHFTRVGGVATLNLTNASIERNQIQNKNPGKNGGGVYIAGTGGPHVVSINNSTFSDNAIQTAGIGGGLYAECAGGSLTLVNSTLSGNNSGVGSAISFQSATLLIRSCTFFSNNCMTDANGSTIRDASNSSFLMRNTILSGNIAMTALRDLSDGQPINGNNNLIGVGGTLVNGVNGNIVGVTNPRLVPLNNNGGLTRTFALQPDSPAIDAAGNGSPTTDQRGQPRPSDGNNDGSSGFDIGAFETQRYLVTNTNNSGANSLRLALEQNNLAGGGFVKFAIGAQGSTQTIPVTGTPLPGISRTVFLDGWSQGGNSYLGPPLIEVDGAAIANTIGLNISAGDCIIRGLAVNAFPGVGGMGVGIGFFDQASLRNWVYGCYIGVGLDGITPRANGQIGVWLAPAANSNIIGTNSDGVNDAAERNIISGSSQNGLMTGVYIQSNANIIAGNHVGTDLSGMIAIPNNNGIWVASGTSNRIGVDPNSANPASGRNVVSGNTNAGIALTSQGSNNLIAGNYVGLKADGNSALPNLVGVSLDNVTLSLVGGQVAAARNIISGNTNQGVLISGANAAGNVLWGNYIGLNAAGDAAVGNGTSGVHVRVGATFTRIGGDGDLTPVDANRRNVISGNNGRGIFIVGTAAQPTASTRVYGNYIGLAADGVTAIGNRLAGVTVSNSKQNLIGTIGGRNFIAGQTDSTSGHGVEITGIDAFSNMVQNNAIGVNTVGQPRPNAGTGVVIADGAIGNLTGGVAPGEGNLIAFNGVSGVRVLGNLSVSNSILGNSIHSNGELGIDLAGDGVTPNGPAGAVRVGPNELQNYPVIESVTAAGVATSRLAARANATFRVEYFSSATPDPSAFGEGLTYLGFVIVQTDATGNSPQFSFNFAPSVAEPWITSTATELAPDGLTVRGIPTPPGTALNTSEFSLAVRINSAPAAVPVFANGVEDTDLTITLLASDPDVGQTITFTVATLPTVGNLFQFGTLTPITSPNTVVADPSGRVVFRPLPNQFGTPYTTFTFFASDGIADSDPALATVSIAPVADTPSVTNATTLQSLQTTSGLVITRNPADGAEVTHYQITSVANGQLFQNDGSTPINNGDFITVAQGAAGLKFTPANLFVGMTTFRVQSSLNATPSGLGGGLATATITVQPRAFTPSVTNATTLEDTQSTSGLVITKSAMNGPEMTHYKITGITNGTLFQNDGVTPIANGAFITVAQGAAGLKFTPTANFFGFGNFDAQASISASDSGLGGAAIPAVITVLPVADTPSVTNATTPRNLQTTSGLVISRNPADGAEVTHFKITGITSGSLFLNDGVTPVTNGQFITFAQGNAGLKFTPALNFVGNGNFSVQASLSNSDSGLGGGVVTATITVTPTALTPSVTNATTLEDTQTTSGLVILPDPADAGATTHFKITGITNGSLFQNDGTTPIANGAFINVAQGAAGLKFTPTANFFGNGNFSIQGSTTGTDAGLGGNVIPATITVLPVADTPSVTNATTPRNVQTTSGLVISRNPADGPEVTHFKITGITSGSLFQNDGVTPIANGQFITFAQGNAGLKFTPALNFVGNGNFSVQASLSNSDSGLGGGIAAATITVTPTALTPSVTNATTLEDTQTTTGLVILPDSADAGATTHFKITGITNGTLFQNDGITPIANNAFITAAQGASGLKFTPTANFFGNGNFNVQGSTNATNAGLGGNVIPATITVLPVADTPSVTNATTYEGQQTTSGLVISRNPADGAEVTHFKITAITNGTLFQNDGVTPIANGQFITFAQGNAGLRFTPTPGLFMGTGNFSVQASISNSDSGLGGGLAVAAITILPINQPPSFTANDPPAVLEGTGSVVVNGWVTSFDPGRPNEGGQIVAQYIVDQVSNPALFAALPAVSTSGVLTYATAATGYGTSTFRVRVRDTGGTDHGGNDTSAPQTFTIIMRPAAACNAVVIDVRFLCQPRTVQPSQINKTPSDPGPGATQTVTFSRDLNIPFPIGTTPVTVFVNYSDGLASQVTCNVSVFAVDCNNNGVPDSCEVFLGELVDCNNNGIADECECLWDQGLFPETNAANANGQLSHEGGGVGGGARAGDDFYLPPSHVYRMSNFVGQMLTNTLPILRKARLEIYESCDGMPVGAPIYVNVKSSIKSTVPAAGGFDLVTYTFNICEDELWLDGGKSYWVTLIGRTDNQGTDTSYWVTTSAQPDPTHILGKPPQKSNAPATWGSTYMYGPWESGADCCAGCVNLAWKISGEACKVAWDNGKPVASTDQNTGGTPSGADGAGLPMPHTVDNFILNPCTTTEVCYLEAYVWTNCTPVHGFAELYQTDCYEPNSFTPIRTANSTKAIATGASITYQNRVLQGYKLVFTNPGWIIPTGGTYWISFGVRGGGSANERSLFAYADLPGCALDKCQIRVLPGRLWQPFNNGAEWVSTGREHAFRIAVKVTDGTSSPTNPGGGTGAAPTCPADVDRNGVVSVDDLFIFMNTWFTGCP